MSFKTDVRQDLEIAGWGQVTKDSPTVTKQGKPLFDLIDGVQRREAVTQADERGTICEMFSAEWKFDDGPLVYMYQASLHPGFVKGWVIHREQDDRLFFATGRLRLVLFDGRVNSPTFQRLNRFEGGEMNRCLIRIPAGVYHAVQNIGTTEAFYYNMPTKPYRHDDPDKYRLPLNSDLIPYKFENPRGW